MRVAILFQFVYNYVVERNAESQDVTVDEYMGFAIALFWNLYWKHFPSFQEFWALETIMNNKDELFPYILTIANFHQTMLRCEENRSILVAIARYFRDETDLQEISKETLEFVLHQVKWYKYTENDDDDDDGDAGNDRAEE